MDAKDLRIGIWVNSKIEGCNKIDLGIIQIDASAMMYLFDVTEDFDRLEPIPLTEDWLIRFGFENDEGEYNSDMSKELILTVQLSNDKWRMSVECETIYNPIEHVHQLQNLYHSLTGEELKKTK